MVEFEQNESDIPQIGSAATRDAALPPSPGQSERMSAGGIVAGRAVGGAHPARGSAIQSLSQLDAVYGKSRAQILRDNMESQIYYRPSNQQTVEYLERCLGKRSSYAHSHTKHEGAETSEGLSEQGIPLLTAQDIKRMGDEDGLPPWEWLSRTLREV
jgi:hypothetical protein